MMFNNKEGKTAAMISLVWLGEEVALVMEATGLVWELADDLEFCKDLVC